MITLTELHNPFDITDFEESLHDDGLTVWQVIHNRYPGFIEFDAPTVCFVNDKPILRKDWNMKLNTGDKVILSTMPVWDYVLYAFISLVISAAVFALYPTPNANTELPTGDSVFSLKGQYNQVKLNEPIESHYGRVYHYPSYGARVWNEYRHNDQYQYALYCLGQGEYTIHGIYIEDTDIDNFDDVTYVVYTPGQAVSLFWVNVVTSVEVENVEMIGTDESGWDWLGGFTLTPVGEDSGQIQVDVVLPNGLYVLEDDGDIAFATVSWEFQYRELNDAGTPIGSWTTFDTYTLTLNTTTPQRYTVTSAGLSGVERVEVRGRRTNTKLPTTRGQDTLYWERARVFIVDTANSYGDVTMLAIKMKATNQLNDQSKARVAVDMTRKLKTYNGTTGLTTATTATTAITPAFYDIFVAAYGANVAETYLNFDQIDDQENNFNTGDGFSHTFDQQMSVWDAAKVVARAGRGTPVINGGLIEFARDGIKTIPTAVFGVDNIVRGSMRTSIHLVKTGDYDGFEVTYLDETTNKLETINCVLSGESGDRLKKVNAYGMRNRDHAYREFMYEMAKRRRITQTSQLTTGLEGLIPSYGDLIGVTHPIVRTWGVSGVVLEINSQDVTLSEKVTFESGKTYQMCFRKEDGSQNGPYTATETSDPYVVHLSAVPSPALYFTENQEPCYFYFGESELYSKFHLLVSREQTGPEEVTLQLAEYDSTVHEADGTSAPALGSNTLPEEYPDRPTVLESGLKVTHMPDNIYLLQLSWPVAYGAKQYRVERRDGQTGSEWEVIDEVTRNYILVDVPQKMDIEFRVAAINKAIGDWAVWTGTVGVPLMAPRGITNLTLVNEEVVPPLEDFETGSNLNEIRVTGNSLRKVAGADGWDTHYINSDTPYTRDIYLHCKPGSATTTDRQIGLYLDTADFGTRNSMDYGFLIEGTTLRVRESGTNVYTNGAAITSATVLEIVASAVQGYIGYFLDGNLIHRTQLPTGEQSFYGEMQFYDADTVDQFTDVYIGWEYFQKSAFKWQAKGSGGNYYELLTMGDAIHQVDSNGATFEAEERYTGSYRAQFNLVHSLLVSDASGYCSVYFYFGPYSIRVQRSSSDQLTLYTTDFSAPYTRYTHGSTIGNNDVIRIEHDGTDVRFYLNDTLIYTESGVASNTDECRLECSTNGYGTGVNNIQVSPLTAYDNGAIKFFDDKFISLDWDPQPITEYYTVTVQTYNEVDLDWADLYSFQVLTTDCIIPAEEVRYYAGAPADIRLLKIKVTPVNSFSAGDPSIITVYNRKPPTIRGIVKEWEGEDTLGYFDLYRINWRQGITVAGARDFDRYVPIAAYYDDPGGFYNTWEKCGPAQEDPGSRELYMRFPRGLDTIYQVIVKIVDAWDYAEKWGVYGDLDDISSKSEEISMTIPVNTASGGEPSDINYVFRWRKE